MLVGHLVPAGHLGNGRADGVVIGGADALVSQVGPDDPLVGGIGGDDGGVADDGAAFSADVGVGGLARLDIDQRVAQAAELIAAGSQVSQDSPGATALKVNLPSLSVMTKSEWYMLIAPPSRRAGPMRSR